MRDSRYEYCSCGCGEKAPIATRNDKRQGWEKGKPKLFIRGHRTTWGISERVRRRRWIGITKKDGRTLRCKLYVVWSNMLSRCKGTHPSSYPYYAGKGISVCPSWSNYSTFRIWAISNGYRKGLSIDRIDCNGNYEPMNCRWADAAMQARNRTNGVITESSARAIRKSTGTLAKIARSFGVSVDLVWQIRAGKIWRNI